MGAALPPSGHFGKCDDGAMDSELLDDEAEMLMCFAKSLRGEETQERRREKWSVEVTFINEFELR